MSDGLVAPLNAPPGGQVATGVQPGAPPIFIGQYVIVFGAAGGVFLYNGTPAKGNPPIVSITQATKDPYGNTVIAGGVNVYNNALGSWVQLGSAALNFWTGDSAQSALGFMEMGTEGSGATRQLFMQIESPNLNSTGTSSLFLQSGSDDGTIGSQLIAMAGASAEWIMGNDPSGNPQFYLAMKMILAAGAFVFATTPGSTAQETWHTLSPYSAGIVLPANGFGQYRITDNNELQVSASLGFSSPGNPQQVNSAALPSGYIPKTAVAASTITTTSRGGHWFPVGCEKLAVPVSPNNSGAEATVTSDGFIVVRGQSTTATTLGFEARIPLDV